MPDDYMNMGGPGEDTAAPEAPEEEKTEEAEGASALIPKALLGGKDFKVGDEVVLKIVHEYEDEVEVEYAPEKPKTTETKPMTADEEIDSMAEEG